MNQKKQASRIMEDWEDFKEEIKHLVLNIPGKINHDVMSTATSTAVESLRDELSSFSQIGTQMKFMLETLKEIKDSLKTDYIKQAEFVLEKKSIEDKIKINQQSVKSIKGLGYAVSIALVVDIASRLIAVAYK